MREYVRLVPQPGPHHTQCCCGGDPFAQGGWEMGKGSPRDVQGPEVTLHSRSQPIRLGKPRLSLQYPPACPNLQDSVGWGRTKLVLNKRRTPRKK